MGGKKTAARKRREGGNRKEGQAPGRSSASPKRALTERKGEGKGEETPSETYSSDKYDQKQKKMKGIRQREKKP